MKNVNITELKILKIKTYVRTILTKKVVPHIVFTLSIFRKMREIVSII